jgi:hypothetical protein
MKRKPVVGKMDGPRDGKELAIYGAERRKRVLGEGVWDPVGQQKKWGSDWARRRPPGRGTSRSAGAEPGVCSQGRVFPGGAGFIPADKRPEPKGGREARPTVLSGCLKTERGSTAWNGCDDLVLTGEPAFLVVPGLRRAASYALIIGYTCRLVLDCESLRCSKAPRA